MISEVFPLVTIALATFNEEDFVSESIESILNQSYENFELIVVDDCSSDNTLEIVTRYSSDERVSLYKNENNSGLAL